LSKEKVIGDKKKKVTESILLFIALAGREADVAIKLKKKKEVSRRCSGRL